MAEVVTKSGGNSPTPDASIGDDIDEAAAEELMAGEGDWNLVTDPMEGQNVEDEQAELPIWTR